ncbi:MAG: hypothetical protein E7398_03975 [Ruminococcaceae bacterium]|nr:hypothetical protein [Oscillospiraceae bacterium]
MFIRILTDTLIIFLVTYAIIDILTKIFNYFFNNTKRNSNKTLMLLYIDSKSNIEGAIRTSAITAKNIGYELLVVISDTSEETEKIILNLSGDYPHLHILKVPPEYINQIISDISSKDV